MFWLGAAVALCYVPGYTGAYIASQWPLLSIVLPFLIWRRGPVTPAHWAGLAFLVYAFVRIWYAPIFNDGVHGFWMLAIMAGSFWLGSTLPDLRKLYAGLAVGVAVSSAVAVAQHFGWTAIPRMSPAPSGLFVNSVALGMISALVIVALATERMWLWALPLLPGLALSGSRGAWFAVAVGLIAVHVRSRWVLAAGAIPLAALLFLPLSHSDALRVTIWQAAYLSLTPLGYGPGSFASWVIDTATGPRYPEFAHNDVLQLAFEYGIAAVVPVGILGIVLARTAQKEWPVLVVFGIAGLYSMPLWVGVASFIGCVAAGSSLRGWCVVWSARYRRGLSRVSRFAKGTCLRGPGAVPVGESN